jgi:phosphoadenosine phosphosulfate reductase
MESIQTEISEFKQKIFEYKRNGLRLFASSSFQTHSIPMIHILSQIDNSIPIYFLNTGYHFPETMMYRDQIKEKYNMNILNLESPISRIRQKDSEGNLMFASDPDQCCFFNKTLPMESILAQNDVWINGVRKDQNENRSTFNKEEKGKHDSLRYHPMLNWTKQMIWHYIRDNGIPHHPLENEGYVSIGCDPCTRKMTLEDANDRGGRWEGMKKTECGLHTDLIDR